ncbi:hypothetical protein KEJ15_09730 [Candidatus Bathyarchaeota archaeon]|nr:hypothetical protein [Candidatus Bathyarchaeota archaeon]
MDKAIAGIAKALKDSLDTVAICVQQTLDVLSNHEQRLQKLERAMSPKGHLRQIERFIEDIQDPVKREAAMAEFASLCHALGIEDLEEEP